MEFESGYNRKNSASILPGTSRRKRTAGSRKFSSQPKLTVYNLQTLRILHATTFLILISDQQDFFFAQLDIHFLSRPNLLDTNSS